MIDILRVGTTIALTPAQIELQHAVGQAWLRTNIEAGTHSPPVDNRSAYKCDDEGAGGSIAFRLMVNLPVQYDLLVWSDGWQNRPDGELPNGWLYNVSQTFYRSGDLSVTHKFLKTPRRDILYALLTHSPRHPHIYTFRGWEHARG